MRGNQSTVSPEKGEENTRIVSATYSRVFRTSVILSAHSWFSPPLLSTHFIIYLVFVFKITHFGKKRGLLLKMVSLNSRLWHASLFVFLIRIIINTWLLKEKLFIHLPQKPLGGHRVPLSGSSVPPEHRGHFRVKPREAPGSGFVSFVNVSRSPIPLTQLLKLSFGNRHTFPLFKSPQAQHEQDTGCLFC